ncbi:LuxR family transcriptional regulator [Bailinhaonella thermotolerans]|uniref:LuxR family transcriptional regulator n=2 Tax=Bailinhaonella thermotolerans TaxID=1070861 RepID=A0A3A4A4A8_9ACTN|nr:LuxR family transcriptional regulator [Bailinhaonella thermotolerans]
MTHPEFVALDNDVSRSHALSLVPRPYPTLEEAGLADEDLRLLAALATGATTETAARRLEVSARTVRRRLRSICDRLGVASPIEAVVWAARRSLI